MFETHVDATYAWLGLAVVSVATAGVAATLPASPPPDAAGVAHTVETVANGEYPATAEHGIAADRLRLTPRSVSLAGDGGRTRKPLRGPRITPISSGERGGGGNGRLRRVLDGIPPESVFDDPDALAAAARRARTADHGWRAAPERLTVRRVHYGGVHVTLVG